MIVWGWAEAEISGGSPGTTHIACPLGITSRDLHTSSYLNLPLFSSHTKNNVNYLHFDFCTGNHLFYGALFRSENKLVFQLTLLDVLDNKGYSPLDDYLFHHKKRINQHPNQPAHPYPYPIEVSLSLRHDNILAARLKDNV
jgi:hypothetical protein